MLKIRLQRIGRKNNPSYRVVVVDSTTAAKKGKPVELLGTYDTIRKTTELNNERILYWLSTGAQASDTMHNILIKNGVIEGVKINTLPRKKPITKEKDTKDTDQAKSAADSTEASDTASNAEDKAPETSESGAPQEKSAESAPSADEKEPQSPPPQNTPSAEG